MLWHYRDRSQSLLIQRSYSYRYHAHLFYNQPAQSQSLLIQRSYSYSVDVVEDSDEQEEVAIPSYSEVLFLRSCPGLGLSQSLLSQSLLIQRSYSYLSIITAIAIPRRVAIPSYSEVLFLPEWHSDSGHCEQCRNPFLFRGPIPTRANLGSQGGVQSQSLLIHRSYSYFQPLLNRKIEVPSQSLLIQRSYSYSSGK